MHKHKNKLSILSTVIMLCMGLSKFSTTYAAENSDEPITQREATAILEELKKIRATLERIEKQGRGDTRNPTTTKAAISAKERPLLGNPEAPVTIVEYSDYQCPFCKRFVDNTLAELKREYIDTGKVRLVFKDMPLSFHKNANKAAQAGHCAGEQGRYWSMHDLIFTNIQQLTEDKLQQHAAQIGLDTGKFNACLASGKYAAQIEQDIAEAKRVGITGTPTFVIGKTTADVITGDVVRGAQPMASLKLVIEKYLAQ